MKISLEQALGLTAPATPQDIAEYISYDPDTGFFCWGPRGKYHAGGWSTHMAHKRAGGNRDGYKIIRVKGWECSGHRLAWFLTYGVWPSKMLDHINGDRSDNRIANLREVTHSQNAMNAPIRATNTTGAKGVHYRPSRKTYEAYLRFEGKKYHLGRHETLDAAKKAREDFERVMFGEYSPLNRP